MTKQIHSIKRRNFLAKPNSAQVYFTGRDKSVYKELVTLSERSGITISKLGAMAIRLGLPLLAKNLDGLQIDIEAQAEQHKRSASLVTK